MPSANLASLEAALKQAKQTYKADKSNAAAKTAYKAAKAALAAAEAAKVAKAAKKKRKRAKETEPVANEKKAKTTIAALEAALAEAKAAHKANKSDAALKKVYKAAKKALAAAQADVPAVAPADEKQDVVMTSTDSNPQAELDGLKKTKETKTGFTSNATVNEHPPNPSLYCGNLSFQIDEDTIKDFFKECGTITDIHWLTDRDSGDFSGRGFITFDTTENATKALALDQTECLNRPMRISYAKARTKGQRVRGGGNDKGRSFVDRPLSARPENCVTAFMGNVSFDITDDAIYELAKDCGEVKSIRWLTDRETGEFKGCGFVDFYNGEDVDKFVKLRGQTVLGRPIRIDYSAPRARN